MAIFGGAPASLDPTLERVFASPPDRDKGSVKRARKAVAGEQTAILTSLEDGEEPLVVAHNCGYDQGAVVVTENRTIHMRKGKVRKQLTHSEVAETRLMTTPQNTTLVIIESHAARLDYSPNDSMRLLENIQIEVATPRIGNQICAEIDQRL